ncbi:unnamed protein product [Plutella xylostella]|uniref:(diamondback moth) hypothetical protein n=1 Tax=Plutella xylostella TaxID=51655 RepID=A0A8S4D175_PLUXY|nr:unnamed protein product [Plutella xylostella]
MLGDAPLRFAALRFGFDEHVHLTRSSSLCSSSHLSLGFGARGFDGVGLNYALAGLRPWWWHGCNVVLHAACCSLVARACVTVARLQRPFAALAALLFAVHPVHTEAVRATECKCYSLVLYYTQKRQS